MWSCERHGCHTPGKDSCRAVNIWVTRIELRGPILSAQAEHQLSIYCIKRSVRQKFSTPGISELSVQNIRYSGEMPAKIDVRPLLSQLWEEKNYCERRNELSSWRPVFLPNRHIHLYLFKLGYDVHALLSSVMYILSGKNITAVYTISRRRWDQNTTQVANRLDQGGRAQLDFSLAWLEAAWYSSGSGHGPTRNWRREAGVIKELSLAGLAKLSRLRYSWLRFGLALADYHGLRGHNRLVYTAG